MGKVRSISEEVATQAFEEIFANMPDWRKQMIHYLKEETDDISPMEKDYREYLTELIKPFKRFLFAKTAL